MQFLLLIIQEKKLFGAIFNNLFTLSSTSCWSFSFAWFNSWKKKLYTSYMFYAYLLSVKLGHDQYPSRSSL